ncbi:MAG: ATP-binding cassette domain-containing protein [Abditibacteriota bacterium]|nr:ATP-binding cassette domain-containing protein [Abditibacteriota bacterium]
MIELRDVHLSFGDKHVLKGVSFGIDSGKTLAIIGTSGAGKSTVLKCICGLVRPQSGSILIDGLDVMTADDKTLKSIRAKLGMVFQYSALFDYLTVYDNVAFGLRKHTSLTEAEIRDKVAEALSMVNLSHTMEMMPSELSGGMKKRVALARSLVLEPAFLLYDEPTSGLDPITTAATNKLINMGRDLGKTSLVVTHDIPTINSVADKIVFIHSGTVIYEGLYDDMINSDNPYVVQFMNGRTQGPIATIG